MTDKPKGQHGGPRPNSGGARPGAGRPKNPPVLLPPSPPQMTALEFLLSVMRDPTVDAALRLTAAAKAAPYCHRKPAATGKKEADAEAAHKRMTGKFAPAPKPFRLVTDK